MIRRILVILGVVLGLLGFNVPTADANASGVFQSDKIYVQNSIGLSTIRVDIATERMDNYSRLDLVMGQCPTTNQCVRVVHADLSDYPLTTSRTRMFALDGSTYYTIIEVDINNMNKAGYTSARRTQTIMHELGHSIGLNHTDRSTSIMRDCGNCGAVVKSPDSLDYAKIRSLYG